MAMSFSRVFLEGPAGTGKTAYAIEHLYRLLDQRIPAEQILVLVPQRTLGVPYQVALHQSKKPYAGSVTVVTLSGLARRNLERFWPLVAAQVDQLDPNREPAFLTNETAQYYMRQFTRQAVDEGIFDAVSIPFPRITAQLLDNTAKAAIADFPFAETADRLIAAWGDRHSSRLQVYRAGQQITEQYRAYCLQNNLLDYAMQLELFTRYLLPHTLFQKDFMRRYRHLIADNIEESGPLAHDFIQGWRDHWQSLLLIMDSDAGYRTFLGADPDNAYGLQTLCDEHLEFSETRVMSVDLSALQHAVAAVIAPAFKPPSTSSGNALAAVEFVSHMYYPQMIDWVVSKIRHLVIEQQVPPSEIVILAPFLNDSLRFALRTQLETVGIPSVSHRPSRALRDEPATRAMLTLLALAHPQWEAMPPSGDVADALVQALDGLDPVRAKLLTGIVYRPAWEELSSFERIQQGTRERITYLVGERYEYLRSWLEKARAHEAQPPDLFLSRLFGEVLSQPGFGFHTDLERGRLAQQLIESARKFRQVLYPQGIEDWNEVGREYLALVQDGLLAALYTASWQDEAVDAVFMAPAFTFLMRNRFVGYQFWLDLGSTSWWERLDQPLTHPYVLTRHYPKGAAWTDEDEAEAQREMLYRVVTGLIRRCRHKIYLGISELGEQGFEQHGPLLHLFQQILQQQSEDESRA